MTDSDRPTQAAKVVAAQGVARANLIGQLTELVSSVMNRSRPLSGYWYVVLADIYSAFKLEPNPQLLYEKGNGTNDGIHPWGPDLSGRQIESRVITAAVVDALEAIE